jgi:hypothetical protein
MIKASYIKYKNILRRKTMKENSKIVFNYIKEHEKEQITAPDIVEGTGIPIKSVNGIITSALIGTGKNKALKSYVERIPGELEVTDEEGNVSHKAVKFIQLTDKGRESTVESIEAEELAAAQAKLAAKNAE